MINGKFRMWIIMCVVILFTSFSAVFAGAELTEEELSFVYENLKFYEGYGYLYYEGLNIKGENLSPRVSITINDEVINKLAAKDLYLVTYFDGKEAMLGVQKGQSNTDVNNIVPIELKNEYGKISLTPSTYIETIYSSDNNLYMDYKKGVNVLKSGEKYGFIAAVDGTNTDNSTLYIGDYTDGNTISKNHSSVNVVNNWTVEERKEIIIDSSNVDDYCVKGNDEKYMYYFKVEQKGTWKVNPFTDITKIEGWQAGTIAQNFGYNEPNRKGEASIDNRILGVEETYCIFFTQAEVDSGITLSYEFLHSQTYVEYQGGVITDENVEKTTGFETIEKIMANFVLTLSKGLNILLADALNQTITLDNIVFDEYEPIKLNFFSTDLFGNSVSANTVTSKLRNSINNWYSIFRNMALIGYMIILVYIGIKILLTSTTADKKANYKDTFMYWVTGILILFFFPYIMKYAIYINDAIVKTIGSDFRVVRTTSLVITEKNDGYLYTDFENAIDFDSGNDYMSKIGKMAEDTEKLGIAIAYMVLTWQLVMMVVYYYKRMFVVAFLIIVFPLIAFTFVWDKLNDGKSQALSAWTKEFLISVFVQSFHAIVYVFVSYTIYATLVDGNADFILLMIASSFMFAGEDILKQIFGGGGTIALGSVTQTGQKILMTTTLVTRVGKNLIRNVVGKDGFIRGNASSIGKAVKMTYMLGKDDTGVSRFRRLATIPAAASGRINMLLPSEGEITVPVRQTAEMVDTFNNTDKKRDEDVADALRLRKKLLKARSGMDPNNKMTDLEKKQYDAIMAQSQYSANQFDRLDMAVRGAAIADASAKTRAQKRKIKQDLILEVEIIFKAKDTDGKVINENNIKVANKFLKASLINTKKYGVEGVKREDVKQAMMGRVEATRERYDRISFSRNSGGDRTSRNSIREERANRLADKYINKKGINKQKDMSVRQQMNLTNFAKHVVALEQGDYTAEEVYDIITELESDKELANDMLKLSNIRTEIDELKLLIAEKIVADNPGPDIAKANGAERYKMIREEWAPEVIRNMEENAKRNAGRKVLTEDYDPYVDILDIIASAQKATGRDNFNSMNEILDLASQNRTLENELDERMSEIRKLNQELFDNSRDFAKDMLKQEYHEASEFEKSFRKTVNGEKFPEYEEPMYDGYTEKDIRKLRRAELANFATRNVGFISDILITPAATLGGMVIGAANTKDGIPIEEGIIGGLSGIEFAQSVSGKFIPGLSGQEKRNNMQEKIQKRVKERLEKDDEARIKAQDAFEDARANAEDLNMHLEFKTVTADLYIADTGRLCAKLHVIASNAEYIQVDEKAISGGGVGGWESYQEDVNYVFKDNNINKAHNLYIAIKDDSGNILHKAILNLKFYDRDA